MSARRLYLAVAACAVVVHLGALWNRFAMDDVYIIQLNALVHSPDGIWRAFLAPYWPPDLGGRMYRPLPLASYAVDWLGRSHAWYHLVNLAWHAGASVAVAALARRWVGGQGAAALAAGLVFAVHPAHVEAIANVVGRAELMAALFTAVAVYAALERDSVIWSGLAFALGLLSKENAVVAPALIALAWALGFKRPSRRRVLAWLASWALIAAAYAAARHAVLSPYGRFANVAPVFVGGSTFHVLLTAVSALADVTRLLVFPLTLRADYSPAERTLVTTPLDPRFALGVLCLTGWAGLFALARRRGRLVEAYGLGWIGIGFLPVANILFPTGVLVAERVLYLPSAGLALAVGAWVERRPLRRVAPILALVVAAGAVRSAVRVPVWHDDASVTLSILEDSPRSYRGPSRYATLAQSARRPQRALDGFLTAARIYDRDAAVYVAAADAAFALGRPALADSLLDFVDGLCPSCRGLYRVQAAAALARGEAAVADSLLRRVK